MDDATSVAILIFAIGALFAGMGVFFWGWRR
jgi:hypothetical protein